MSMKKEIESEETMKKGIILEFERGGTVFAELLEEKAPRTCKAILDVLPFEHRIIHAMWGGQEIFFDGFPLSKPLEFENVTNNVEVGDVACISSYVVRPSIKKSITSFCIFYGKSRPRKSVDETEDVNVFAKIKDIQAITKIGRRIRFEGAEKILIKPGSSMS